MTLSLWKPCEHFRKLPPTTLLTQHGRRVWDFGIDYQTPSIIKTNNKGTLTMPCFGRHGRWGNMIFQYLFMRVLALENNRDIELYRSKEWINDRLCLYKDMTEIPDVQTPSGALLINDYEFEIGYIPRTVWRALYVTKVRKQKCYILKDFEAAVSQPLPLDNDDVSLEVEGAYIMGPSAYNKYHKEFIVSELVKPIDEFAEVIESCIDKLGHDKTLVGIHIRRGDFIQNPLGQQFDLPVPTRYIIEWLATNLPHLQKPVLFVSSDDENAYKEIEAAGFEVYHKEILLTDAVNSGKYKNFEQVEWELLRRCDVLINSNSSFSFSAALLSLKIPTCYRFSVEEKKFKTFLPWQTEPLRMYAFSQYMWSTLYSRFTLVRQMVTLRKGMFRLKNDVKYFTHLQKTKVRYLYYIHGFSLKYFRKVLNPLELFRVSKNR